MTCNVYQNGKYQNGKSAEARSLGRLEPKLETRSYLPLQTPSGRHLGEGLGGRDPHGFFCCRAFPHFGGCSAGASPGHGSQ